MDDVPVTTLADTLTESPEQPSAWSIPDDTQPRVDILAIPERLNEVPEWIRTPLRRFLRLKQRNWPAKNTRQRTRNLFNRMNHMISFFIQHYEWNEWQQLSPRWLEAYIDTKLREGKAANTINWDLIYFRALCQFFVEEGFDVPQSILKLKILDTPRRLPHPLSLEQVRQVECCIQSAITEAKNDRKQQLAVRDLACFYLLWHCGLRISEVCSLLVKDVDLESRKLFIRNSKERKDRMVYISDTVAMALQQHLVIRFAQSAGYMFASRSAAITTRSLQRRLNYYGKQCGVPVNARRLRHTFASQMLAASMPVTSLQRYMGHEHLDTTMIYAEVSDPMLQQDYYQGISAMDPTSANLLVSNQETFRQLILELKTPGLDQTRHAEILEQMQSLLESRG
jgi:site-specific recombinase XerD